MARTLLCTLPIGVTRLDEREKAGGWFKETPEGFNAPDAVSDVPVYLDPDLEVLGCKEWMYDGWVIVLRAWSLTVLVHEILHVAVDHITSTGMTALMVEHHGHGLVNPIEIAIAPLIHTLAEMDRNLTLQAVDHG